MTTVKPFDAGDWFPIHTAVFDAIMPTLSAEAWKALCVAIRLTWGCTDADAEERPKWRFIFDSQFRARMGGEGQAAVSMALQECVEAGYLVQYEIEEEQGELVYVYALNCDVGIEVLEDPDSTGTETGPTRRLATSDEITRDEWHTDNIPPMRKPRGLSTAALKSQYPVQPRGMSPDDAFNLALDKAIALLPAKLRIRAGDSFYTLAAEAHRAALENPSRRWPDAGGGGWVLDAVQDANATDQMKHVNYIQTLIECWLIEGNPYSMPSGGEEDKSDEISVPFDDILEIFWRTATGGGQLDREGRNLLTELLGFKPGGFTQGEILNSIHEVANRYGGTVELTPELVRKTMIGEIPLPPLGAEPLPELEIVEAPSMASQMSADVRDGSDPVLAQVVDWYLARVSQRMDQVFADSLRDLTQRQRNLDVWEYAFWASGSIPNSLGRWNYIKKVILSPEMDRVNAWLKAGKSDPEPKPREKQPSRRSPGGQKRRGKQASIPTEEDMPDPPVPDEVLPPPN